MCTLALLTQLVVQVGSCVWIMLITRQHAGDIIIDHLSSSHNGTHNPKMLQKWKPGRANFVKAGHTKDFPDLSHQLLSLPWMQGDIKKSYRLVYWRELPGQGKESCTVCLIEHHVVNCLCVGGEKSICFLTAVTSGPLGEKLEQTDTCTNTRTCRALPSPSNHALQVQSHTFRPTLSLLAHHTLKCVQVHSVLGEGGRARGVIEPRQSRIHLLIVFLPREESGTWALYIRGPEVCGWETVESESARSFMLNCLILCGDGSSSQRGYSKLFSVSWTENDSSFSECGGKESHWWILIACCLPYLFLCVIYLHTQWAINYLLNDFCK